VGGSESITLDDPQISQVYYRSIQTGTNHTYRLQFDSAGTVTLGLNSPVPSEDPPRALLRGLSDTIVLHGSTGFPEYEPFAPDVYYPVGEFKRRVSAGTYTVTVSGAGPYALIVGTAERFTAGEWIVTALEIQRTRLWSGRWWILLPGLLPIPAVFWWFYRNGRRHVIVWLTGLAGAFCLGTGASTLTAFGWSLSRVNPGWASLVAMVLITVHTVIGTLFFRQADPKTIGYRWQLGTTGLSLLAFFTWSGAVFGPFFGLVAVFLSLFNYRSNAVQ
jgi:hypothetical protein